MNAGANNPNELLDSAAEDGQALVELVDAWTNLAGAIYSLVCFNEDQFPEFMQTVAWQLIRSTAQGQEKLHEIAVKGTTDARSNDHTN